MPETDPHNRRLGYARISTLGQTLDSQLERLRADGCKPLFREKVTGARADRRELLKMLKAIARGATAEGPNRAKKRDQHMGRPPKLTQQQNEERRRAERATLKELTKSYNVGRSTISRLAI
ncbi:MAG: recombinase family protein [Acetobacteraceae bacterium]|nr:recombinase family protein [Acetobacteraceae bacterium]